MAFKPLFRALIHTARNFEAPNQYYLSMIRSFGPHPPSFCLLNKGIPSLGKFLLSSYSSSATNDGDDHQIKHQKSKKFVGGESPLLEDALVQVICGYEASYLGHPFSKYAEYRRRATNGFIIEGRRLLTAAHCIEHHSNVSIKKQGSNTIYQAKVIATAHDFNLAMLTVSDDEFWEGVGSVEWGDMPSPRDELTTMSYLDGMTTVTSRSGFVSDAGMINIFDLGLEVPAFVVNCDSKFKESGSAVFNENGKCVGMALDASENIYRGCVIPVTIIKHFIQDYDRNGRYTGVPIFGVKWQKMENHDLRMYMDMQHDQEGVLITDTELGCPELEILELDDVILGIDGVKVANDGTVPFVRGWRINFNYLFTRKYTGDNVLVKVLRNSEMREFSIKLAATRKQYVPEDIDWRPRDNYYIIGGLVFSSITITYERASDSFVEKYYGSVQDWLVSPILRKECVVVSQVLEAEVNKGYSVVNIVNYQVVSLNCKPVKGLKELVSMVENCQCEYLCFVLQNDQVVVFRTNTAKESTPGILKTYGIPSSIFEDSSNDLKDFQWGKEDGPFDKTEKLSAEF